MNNNEKANKLIGLEIIRFISAFAILVWHYQHFTFFEDKPVDLIFESQPFFSILSFFYTWGLYGVQIFWCVSGFIFFWKYKDLITQNKISGKNFFILRFTRLYPLHFITLILVAILQIIYFKINGVFFVYQFNDLYHFLLQIFFISDWGFGKGFSFNGVIWSISIEILIYIFFFLSLKYLLRSRSLKTNFLIIIFSLFILYTEEFQNVLNYSLVVSCLCLFYAGGIAAVFYEKFNYNKNTIIFLLFTCVITPFLINFFQIYMLKNWLTIFLLTYVPIVLFLFAQIKFRNLKLINILKIFGNLTYSSYLIHIPIQMTIIMTLSYLNVEIPFYSNFFFLFYLITILLLSRLTFCYFEKPIQDKLRNYFLK